MDPDLRLYPGQEALTPAQEAEARRFAEASIRRQLSTEPVDELETEAFLRQVYQVVGLDGPQHLQWLDGPLHLMVVLAPETVEDSLRDRSKAIVGEHVWSSVRDTVWTITRTGGGGGQPRGDSLWSRALSRVQTRVNDHLFDSIRGSLWSSVSASVSPSVWARVWEHVGFSIEISLGHARVGGSVWDGIRDSVRAYESASDLAFYSFFDVYFAPNDLQAMARFNEGVSGYWLCQEAAVLVRRPRMLALDEQGHLHNASGRCIEYHDGWGFYAWHGVEVPENVILAPEMLTGEDFLNEWNVERRRLIQERMGKRLWREWAGSSSTAGQRGRSTKWSRSLRPLP